MKRMRFIGGMMGLLLGCATASPPQQAPSGTNSGALAQSTQQKDAAATNAKKDPDRTLVCENIAVTGTRIPRKVCRTVRQMEQEREAAQKALRGSEKVNRDWGQ